MKSLQELYNENPNLYMQMAQQANREQKILSVKNDALFLQEQPLPKLINTIKIVREIRNDKLAETDWTQMPDLEMPDEKRTKWKIYRQKLRDLPAQAGFPRNVEWPAQP